MDNPVVIKGNKHGITVFLDAKLDFGTLKELVAEKFRDSCRRKAGLRNWWWYLPHCTFQAAPPATEPAKTL